MAVLEIRDLHVTVETDEGTTPILNGVDLTVRTGETHAIMGPRLGVLAAHRPSPQPAGVRAGACLRSDHRRR